MKTLTKTLAVAAALSLFAGGALAAEKAMDCCAKCECCKDKKPDSTPLTPQTPPQGGDHKH